MTIVVSEYVSFSDLKSQNKVTVGIRLYFLSYCAFSQFIFYD